MMRVSTMFQRLVGVAYSLALLGGGLVLAAAAGVACGWLEERVYVIFLYPATLGMGLGVGAGIVVHRVGLRPAAALGWALFAAGAAWAGLLGGRLAVDRDIFAQAYRGAHLEGLVGPEDARLLDEDDPLLSAADEERFWREHLRVSPGASRTDVWVARVRARLDVGVRTMGAGGLDAPRAAVAVVWGAEAGLIALLMAGFALAVARTPRCPHCGRWLQAEPLGRAPHASAEDAVARAARGEPWERARRGGVPLLLERCPECDTRPFVRALGARGTTLASREVGEIVVVLFAWGVVGRAVGGLALLGTIAGCSAWGERVRVADGAVESTMTLSQVPRCGDYTTQVGGIRLIAVTGGEFTLGSSDAESGREEHEGPQRRVKVGGLWVGQTEVTQAQYEAVMGGGSNPSHHRGATQPVENVTWYQAIDFCNALSDAEGRARAYHGSGDAVMLDLSADGYRLPTEAEWEYFARAGTTTRYSFGDDAEKLGEYAWYHDGNSTMEPYPVKAKKPNSWGLYDIHGNVWEWCWDWYAGNDGGSETDGATSGGVVADNPVGPPGGDARVRRGGSAWNAAWVLRSAFRNRSGPGDQSGYRGFRIVRSFQRHHR